MKGWFLKVWGALKSPFVFIGLALLAVVVVLLDVYKAGRRKEKVASLDKEAKHEKDAVDAAVKRHDPDSLKRDILRRANKK